MRLEVTAQQLAERETGLLAERAEVVREREELESQRVLDRIHEEERRQELALVQGREEITRRHLAQLREEVDRLGLALMDENASAPVARAA
jgi:hypothetical protein